MSDYIITNDGELMHYGVPGMKWGKRKARLEQKTLRKYGKAGRSRGVADYERSKGNEAYKKHDDIAKTFDKQAKKYESSGSYFKAELARQSAQKIRARGANVQASREKKAEYYLKRSKRLEEKASAFATKKRVDVGKKQIDKIFKESTQKGYNNAKRNEEWRADQNMREVLGDTNYKRYNKIRGK